MSQLELLLTSSDEMLMSITKSFLQTSEEAKALYLLNPLSDSISHDRLNDSNFWSELDIATLADEWSKNAEYVWSMGGVPAPPLDEWSEYLQNKK